MNAQKHKFIKPVWQVREKTEPFMADFPAMLAVAASIVAMIFLGQAFILLLYALWLPKIYYKGQWIIKPRAMMILPVAIALYSMMSAIWSVHPGLTLRAAVQFGSVICCALIISRIVRPNIFIKGLTLGMCIALGFILLTSGSIQAESALTGGLGSKNQVGANAQIGFYSALLCFFLLGKYWQKFLIALPAILLCGLCLILSQSATAIVSLLAIIIISLAGYLLAKLSKQLRIFAYMALFLLMVATTAISSSVNLEEIGLKATGKDVTLTGRTYLWEEGIKAGMENPILGYGLGAFWIPGNPEAEKIWYKFRIYSKSGFHFHNLFINIFVELGVIGLALWLLMYLYSCAKSVRCLLKSNGSIESVFYVGISFMYLIRSISESDTGGPYGVGPLLFFYIVFRIASQNTLSTDNKPMIQQGKL